MKIHPAAEAFPMMDSGRYGELVEDIRKHGQIEAITTCDGMILDGRNRFKACQELGIVPKTREHIGDPWAYAWSMNGQRRDLVADQRYLIWKFCHENSESFQAEKKRIADEANRKRAEAAKEQPRTEDGTRLAEKQVVEQKVPVPDTDKGKASKALLSQTNRGAVARGDLLMKKRPDIAHKVMRGEMKPADAYREMNRAEIKDKLESVEAVEAKKATGLYDVIVIDPPWNMQKIERDERQNQIEFDYPTMSIEEIRQIKIPTANDCHIWLDWGG